VGGSPQAGQEGVEVEEVIEVEEVVEVEEEVVEEVIGCWVRVEIFRVGMRLVYRARYYHNW